MENQQQDHVVAQKIKSTLGQWQRDSPGKQQTWTESWTLNQPVTPQTKWHGSYGSNKNDELQRSSKRPRVVVSNDNTHDSSASRQRQDEEIKKTLPCGLVPNEWSVPPKIVGKGPLIAAVRKGVSVPGNFVFVHDEEDAQEIKDIWQSLNLQTPLTVARLGSHGG